MSPNQSSASTATVDPFEPWVLRARQLERLEAAGFTRRQAEHLLSFPSCYRTRCGEPFGITRPAEESDNVCWACTALAEGDAVVRGER